MEFEKIIREELSLEEMEQVAGGVTLSSSSKAYIWGTDRWKS